MANNKIIKLPTAARVNDLSVKESKGGYIKHYRSIQEEQLWLEGSTLEWKLYCKIRDDANWQANSWTYEGKQYSCLPGELITSVQNLVDKLYSKRDKITPRKVRVALDNLVKYGNILIETGWQTKIIITDKKHWTWKPEHGGWVLVGNEWLYFNPGTEEIEAYFKQNREKLILLYSNNTVYNVKKYVKTFPDFPEPETPANKELPGFDDAAMSRNMSRHMSTIEEVQEEKKEEEEKTASSNSPNKKEEAENTSPLQWVVTAYYNLFKEYTNKNPDVNYNRDIKRIDESPNKSAIIADGPDKVLRKLRGWFVYDDDWKQRTNYPFAAFCKQYTSVREAGPEPLEHRILIDNCRECGGSIFQGIEHVCETIEICESCNVGFKAKGPPGQWTKEEHDCEKEQAARRQKEEDYKAGKIDSFGNRINGLAKDIGKQIE